MAEPRVRVALLALWHDRVLLCRQEKGGREYWMLPGGGVDGGETLTEALRRELGEELGLWERFPLEGPIAVAESIAPGWRPGDRHVIHVVFGVDLSSRSLQDVETRDVAVRGARLFALDELGDVVLHPPITRFVERWRPGDPAVYLGSLWSR
ncbi:MAG TPA: NUDIX hydrolase [Gaiellaceae bacterium]|nr:NUDIX hydrolase [Gaiellaceae bacterium]